MLRWILNVADLVSLAVRRERSRRSGMLVFRNATSNAHRATTYSRCVIGFQRLWYRPAEHLVLFDDGQPVGYGSGVIVARAKAMALDERSRAEFFQTGTRGHQGLAVPASACVSMLKSFRCCSFQIISESLDFG